MNQQNSGDKLEDKRDEKRDPQDPERMHMQPPIPTHPPDPQTTADADKVVASAQPAGASNDPPIASTGLGSGPVVDAVGGAGLGQAPGAAAEGERPATTRDRDVRAVDQQDRTGHS
jgi:hypothetical protein